MESVVYSLAVSLLSTLALGGTQMTKEKGNGNEEIKDDLQSGSQILSQ